MDVILQFFAKYAFLIYLLLVIGIMFVIRALSRARHEMGESLYGLEREIARRHTSQGIAALSLIILLAIAEFFILVFLKPTLPATSLLVTPSLNPLATSTISMPPELLGTLGALTPIPTPTSQITGCIPGQIMIASPKPGDVIQGQVMLMGTANIPNFGFYKYEFSPYGSDTWSTIQADRKIKQDTELGLWDTSEVAPGDYNLQLVVIDNQGNSFPPCNVPVRIISP